MCPVIPNSGVFVMKINTSSTSFWQSGQLSWHSIHDMSGKVPHWYFPIRRLLYGVTHDMRKAFLR
ncbi:hypothetical protein BKA12_001963 [Neomicrococcus lactis]|uniref:Uncharacterized protein n=1 Tax=Neomicrococcus lactis TaxID=732241 RepID=A0A7W8YC72_9MICC|nr:hypothetical protein [Neomicrococcus lactis]